MKPVQSNSTVGLTTYFSNQLARYYVKWNRLINFTNSNFLTAICIYLVKNHFPTAPATIMCWQPVQNCMNQKRPSRLYHRVTCNKFWNNIFWTITLPCHIYIYIYIGYALSQAKIGSIQCVCMLVVKTIQCVFMLVIIKKNSLTGTQEYFVWDKTPLLPDSLLVTVLI
jgi:hypothetical protein